MNGYVCTCAPSEKKRRDKAIMAETLGKGIQVFLELCTKLSYTFGLFQNKK